MKKKTETAAWCQILLRKPILLNYWKKRSISQAKIYVFLLNFILSFELLIVSFHENLWNCEFGKAMPWADHSSYSSIRQRGRACVRNLKLWVPSVSISSGQYNLMKTYHNEANTNEFTKIALKKILDFFRQSSKILTFKVIFLCQSSKSF